MVNRIYTAIAKKLEELFDEPPGTSDIYSVGVLDGKSRPVIKSCGKFVMTIIKSA